MPFLGKVIRFNVASHPLSKNKMESLEIIFRKYQQKHYNYATNIQCSDTTSVNYTKKFDLK